MAAFRHRFTLRQTRRTVPIMFSIELVQASERRSFAGSFRRLTVSISSSPSRMLAATPGGPFFTTKPAGEGTGLGLSISHDIIVKQHGGSIEVDTQPGEFTEFRIVLPRAGASLIKSGERV